MKKFFLLLLVFGGCAVSSGVQSYRFSTDPALHKFEVVQNAVGNSWELFIDGAPVCSGGFDIMTYEKTIIAQWNGKTVKMNLYYTAGFLGIGKKVTAAVNVESEKVAEFVF